MNGSIPKGPSKSCRPKFIIGRVAGFTIQFIRKPEKRLLQFVYILICAATIGYVVAQIDISGRKRNPSEPSIIICLGSVTEGGEAVS